VSDYSRRAFLERVVATAGGALLTPLTPVQAQQPRPGELPISGIAHPKLASFDTLMTTFVREQQAPGAVLAVTKDRRLVYARGFGWADRQRQQAVQPTALLRPCHEADKGLMASDRSFLSVFMPVPLGR
jgi:CubicO group peptidase (beta-lactamase class C family)